MTTRTVLGPRHPSSSVAIDPKAEGDVRGNARVSTEEAGSASADGGAGGAENPGVGGSNPVPAHQILSHLPHTLHLIAP